MKTPISERAVGFLITSEADYEAKTGQQLPMFDPERPISMTVCNAGIYWFARVENGNPKVWQEFYGGIPNLPGKRTYPMDNRLRPHVLTADGNGYVTPKLSRRVEALQVMAEVGGENMRVATQLVAYPGQEIYTPVDAEWKPWVFDLQGDTLWAGEVIGQRDSKGMGHPGRWNGAVFVHDKEPGTYSSEFEPLPRPLRFDPSVEMLVLDTPSGQIGGGQLVIVPIPFASTSINPVIAKLEEFRAKLDEIKDRIEQR